MSQPHYELLSLETLERYRLVARLAQGGMAEVFFAARELEPYVHEPVVIKRLHRHLAAEPSLVQMFLDEARLLCELEHPHIVKTLEAGMMDGHCCIAMEYLEGQSLQAVLHRMHDLGNLPIDLAVYVSLCVLDGLGYAHDATDESGRSLDIVHRDVSPHNVFVTNAGDVKLLDFGIAKAATQEGRTETGVVKGKVGYVAPEQVSAEAVDRRADVWAAGVVLWEALTGRRLFKADSEVASINLTLRAPIPAPSSVRAEIPVALDEILARALERHPDSRYQSAGNMHADLTRWFSASAGSAARDARADLARLMQACFASEQVEQRRLVSVLIARSDCMPPSWRASAPGPSSSPPSSTGGVVASLDEAAPDASTVAGSRPRGLAATRAYALIVVVALLFAALSAGLTVFLVARLRAAPVGDERPAAAITGTRAAAPEVARGTETLAPVAPALPPSVRLAVPQARIPVAPLRARRPAEGVPGAMQGAEPAVAMSDAVVARRVPAPGSDEPTPAFPSSAAKPAKADAPPDDSGFLTIDSAPWSIVSTSGKALGQTPLVRLKLSAGPHVLVLRNPELGVETTYTVNIEPGKTVVRRVGIE